jgi:hypothetical protein
MNDQGQPKPVLGYRTPADERLAVPWRALAFAAGAIPGAVVVLFFGLEWYLLLYVNFGSPRAQQYRPGGRGVPALTFGLLAAAAAVGVAIIWRAERRRWVILGLLTGVGVAALVEGICFAPGLK